MMTIMFALFTGWSNGFHRDPQTYGYETLDTKESSERLHRLRTSRREQENAAAPYATDKLSACYL